MSDHILTCETVGAGTDPFIMPAAVDRVAGYLIESGAPEAIRMSFCSILDSKADDTASRHIAKYLRNVAANCRTPLLKC